MANVAYEARYLCLLACLTTTLYIFQLWAWQGPVRAPYHGHIVYHNQAGYKVQLLTVYQVMEKGSIFISQCMIHRARVNKQRSCSQVGT